MLFALFLNGNVLAELWLFSFLKNEFFLLCGAKSISDLSLDGQIIKLYKKPAIMLQTIKTSKNIDAIIINVIIKLIPSF
jgi:hypothetical protein